MMELGSAYQNDHAQQEERVTGHCHSDHRLVPSSDRFRSTDVQGRTDDGPGFTGGERFSDDSVERLFRCQDVTEVDPLVGLFRGGHGRPFGVPRMIRSTAHSSAGICSFTYIDQPFFRMLAGK